MQVRSCCDAEHGRVFSKAGEQIQVPNVEPFEVPQPATIAPSAAGDAAQRSKEAQRRAEPRQPGEGVAAKPTARGTAASPSSRLP
jgi:hypothetical protein